MNTDYKSWIVIFVSLFLSCSKGSDNNTGTPPPEPPSSFNFTALKVNGTYNGGFTYYGVNKIPVIKFSFSTLINAAAAASSINFKDGSGTTVPFTASLENGDSTVVVQPATSLQSLVKYTIAASTTLQAQNGGRLQSPVEVTLITAIDATDKFPRLTDAELLDVVQKQTFKYFWDFGHPVSGLARERNTSGDVCTTGGTGFGVMAILSAINRHFISREDGLTRIAKIVDFYKDKCTAYHGAFAHWINGATGSTVPFSTKDNGADLVETSYLMQGLLCARQYFTTSNAAEASLRNDINALWNGVEWSWFRKENENVLYWHWSPDYNWDMNVPIRGWNECLITYVLAAASPKYPIPKATYDSGWANNGAIKNSNTYYGVSLPLGPPNGGPLFFAHYSFLGINPTNLSDAYANYWEQNQAHTLINYNYCKLNPKNYYGYSDSCWGLTASDDNKSGYLAHEPNNDDGVISPTTALSSFPYTPDESMKALKFFYYKLGDKIWKEYGFVDAFNLTDLWFADSFLAIDQGPTIVMIENYRSGLLWNLFMSCPEVKRGMTKLGFSGPNL